MPTRVGFSTTGLLIALAVAAAVAVAVIVVARTDTTGEQGSRLGKQFTYDLTELRRTDPKSILYKEATDRIKLDLKEPLAIAVDHADRIYVAGDKAIHIFSSDGRRLSEITTGDTPRCLAVTKDGTIYVGISDHVEIYDSKGKPKARWASPAEKTVLTSIAVSEDNVFVADAGSRVVLRYDTSGKLIGRIGKKDAAKNIPGFVVPSPYFDLAVAPDGLLRVVNPGRHRIEAYTFDGYLEFSWGKFSTAMEGFCGCCNPVNFSLLPGGGFVTAEKGLTRVKIYDADGDFVGVVAGPELFSRHDSICSQSGAANCNKGGLDVAVDSKGRILVMDPLTRDVRIFTRKPPDNASKG